MTCWWRLGGAGARYPWGGQADVVTELDKSGTMSSDLKNDIITPEQQAVLIAKVERLWRKARSSNFPAEAEAYEEKALYLMARARITDAMLNLDHAGGDRIVDLRIGDTLTGGYRIPSETIFSTVCKAFGCRGYLYVSGRRSQPAAVGFASDVDRVKFLWPLLLNDALVSSAQLKGRNAAQTSAMRRSSMFGYAEAISERFAAINRIAADDNDRGVDQSEGEGSLRRSESRGQQVSSTALMVKSREEQVDAHFDGLGVSNRARRVSGGYGGHEHGRAAGMKADLTGGSRGVNGGGGQLTP